MHGHPNNNSCVDNGQNEIAVLEWFVAVVRVAVEEEAYVICTGQEERDLIVVIVVIEGNGAVEVYCYVGGVESEDGTGFVVWLLSKISIGRIECW